MARTYVVEITVSDNIGEAVFGSAMVKGLQDGDIHHMSFLTNIIQDITVRPWEEPAQEWEVHVEGVEEPFGCHGTEDQAIEMARVKFPGHAIIGTIRKE